MSAAQITTIALLCLSVGVNIARHGERRTIDGNGAILSACIWVGLLWWGGFWE